MSSDRPHPPAQPGSSAVVRSGDPQRDWQLEAPDPSWDSHQLRRMSWRAEGAQDYPGGALGTLLEIAQRRRGPRYQVSDARLREIVCELLTEDPDIDASDIEVEVREGEVTLRGTVRERSQKRRAEELIASNSAVSEVQNWITVGPWQSRPM
jgi:HSP20 family molecular chaperone IbpA